MAAVTLLGSLFGTAAGTKTVTLTPAVNDLIVIVTAHTLNTSTTTPPTDDQGGTYVLIDSALKNTSGDVMCVFIRTALVSAAVSTIYSTAPGTTNGGGLFVYKVTGMSRTGTAASRQTAKQENQAAATPAPVFAAAPLTTNPIIGGVFNATSPATMTPRTGFTENTDQGYATPTAGFEGMSRDSGETATTQTWGNASASAYCALVIELDASAAASASPPFAPPTLSHLIGR